MNNEKAALRRQVMAEIEALPEEYIAESNAGIFMRVVGLPEFAAAKTVFSYFGLGREPDTALIIRHALRLGKTVALPVCFKGGLMEARAIEDLSALSKTRFGLLEPLSSRRVIPPEELDFIVVPALTFDRDGYRLGRGGGYYDRFLAGLRAYTVGLARERLMREALPREAHDVPVMCVATEKSARLPKGASPKT